MKAKSFEQLVVTDHLKRRFGRSGRGRKREQQARQLRMAD